MKFSSKTQALISQRCSNKCELCGQIAVYHQFHHRRPRGMGGSKNALTGSPCNALFLHPGCHALVESIRENALDNGWLVRQGINPSEVPVKLHTGWVLLLEDGSVSPVVKFD
jgi:hypothetical protein